MTPIKQAPSNRPRDRRRWVWGVALGSAAIASAAVFYFWLTMLSPFGFEVPEEFAHIDPTREHRVFVYGTLRSPWVRRVVMGRSGMAEPARLMGYSKQALDVVPDPNGITEGYVVTVSAAELRRLDRYERIGVRYERFKLELEDGSKAWVYRRLAE